MNAARGSDFVFGGRGNDSPGSSPNGHNPAYHLEGGPGRDVVEGSAGVGSVTDVYGPINVDDRRCVLCGREVEA